MQSVAKQFSQALQWLSDAASKLSIRGDRAPIADVDRLFDFVATRSAWITQKKLYGYLKERIGIRYPEMFEDQTFAQSINIAKMEVFAACLADMTVFAMMSISENRTSWDAADRERLARACYSSGLEQNVTQAGERMRMPKWQSAFERRIQATNWQNLAAGASAFTESPKALVKWAPIADEHKVYDREVVENSIRFAWNEVIQDFRSRLEARLVLDNWLATRRDQSRP